MASRVATVVLAGALPVSPRTPAAAPGGSQFVAWTNCPSRHRGIRCGVPRASRSRPHHPSSSLCTAEDGLLELLKSAVAALAIIAQISVALPANAILYSPDTNVPRTGELALRRAIPANPKMKTVQESLEDISYLLRIPQRKPYGSMEGDVKKAMKIVMENKETILESVPVELKEKGSELYTSLLEGKGGLQTLLKYINDKDNDRLSVALASSLDTLAELELLQAPGLSFLLPKQYLDYPRLTGRGVVEFAVEKGDGSTFFPTAGGEPKSVATIQVVVDGYSAPLTAGNFVKLSGLGGISFDEGQFSVFGKNFPVDTNICRYATAEGRDVLSQIKTGDKIRSAKLVQGRERLVLPAATAPAPADPAPAPAKS
ncbi:peptidyl-prolyl cis-trans isomerase CYP37, chloroplastic isoform X3 [Brachypodium distachyon]|uniref:peptidyl-prolyl cis-trans isomerase CYP37, chloroplastic isoform X3 n=1 Tax=Brachypodium distachyon TaxID=15368 RepID=UPI000D0DB362|nr:peptidyl-prolyl cis-trans isomerase CYP37, chloroplastic isoform X3 [Brachypodium distachyon]|eukprot:XP_024312458.1 peptidyl-prolyl cis-trans isomerase CYP37, chloroplastic isoform X3 [Brachypodium distachyon]